MHLHMDCETYSKLDVKQVGAYRYAEDPSTEVLIWCWAIDNGPVHTWLPWKQRALPPELAAMVQRRDVWLCAHNAQFERAIWQSVLVRRHGARPTRIEQWVCTAVLAAQCNLPRNLDGATSNMKLDELKDPAGDKLIRVFCKPRKPTKANAATRVLPNDMPHEFKAFVAYCQQDVRAERALHIRLPAMPSHEQRLFTLDMRINERGLPIDVPLVHKALPIVEQLAEQACSRAVEITNGIRPTQVAKLREWVVGQGVEVDNLQAETIGEVIINPHTPAHVQELLSIRLEAGIVSTKKFYSMLRVCSKVDNRARGTGLFYGAHTGRWSGKLIQPHNFKRGLLSLHHQQRVIDLLLHANATLLSAIFDNPIGAVSMVMRSFIATVPGRLLRVVDYSAIELRVIAWLVGEMWLLDALRRGLNVYSIMAGKIYKRHPDDCPKGTEEYRIGKNLTLGCGYQLGGPKFVEYCARNGGYIEEDKAIEAVRMFRAENPMIKASWKQIENAAIAAVQRGQPVRWGRIVFEMQDIWLTILLPSGRRLYYPYPKVVATIAFGKPKLQLTFKEEFKDSMWRTSTYGGRLLENIVQAIARDLMAEGMVLAEEHGYPIIGTVHDEIINEDDEGTRRTVQEFEHVVCKLPKWADGLPMKAEGFETQRYRKG